ncbi:MAG: SDR family NAD(P)-dependent oxidoreductase [Lentimicrobium sp.]|nr:SDR family NAD(P)-dependent oxidoreductase [Lentimicrobium sp.]
MDFNGKCFWITGAASGMGKSLSLLLASFNTQLILSDRDVKGLSQVADKAIALGARVLTLPLDMSDSGSIRKAVSGVLTNVKRIDGLYQFAGISQRSLIIDTPLENDRKIMEVNFFGVIELAKALLPHMIDQGGGQMAVTSSLVGKFGFPYRSAYSASKHALHGYFESLRTENSLNNIRVSILIPGRIQTNISLFALDKDGKEHGKMDPGQANGITAEKAARQILKGLRKEKKEIHVGGKELLMLYIRRFFPALFYYISSRIKPV